MLLMFVPEGLVSCQYQPSLGGIAPVVMVTVLGPHKLLLTEIVAKGVWGAVATVVFTETGLLQQTPLYALK
jgi:hypothetical protein